MIENIFLAIGALFLIEVAVYSLSCACVKIQDIIVKKN